MTDIEKFIIARWIYSMGGEYISNADYTILLNTIKAEYPDFDYVNRSWSSDPCPVALLKKYGLEQYIQKVVLVDKTESIESLGSFVEVEDTFRNFNEEGTISYKHDGWNIQASYYNGQIVQLRTRGRSRDFMDASVLMSRIPDEIPAMGKVAVIMELTISNEYMPLLREKLGIKSQRAGVSSVLANPEYLYCLEMHAFDIKAHEEFDVFPTLESWGFKTPEWYRVHNYEDIYNLIYSMSNTVDDYGSPTDGLVVAASFARAIRVLKWEEPIYKSFVDFDKPYIEMFGAHRISVSARIFPIKLPNSKQVQVACTNYQRIIDYNLRPGYPIAFKLTSHAIAVLDEVNTRLVQKQWAGKFDEYRNIVAREEGYKEEY